MNVDVDANPVQLSSGPLTRQERAAVWHELNAGAVGSARMLLPFLIGIYAFIAIERVVELESPNFYLRPAFASGSLLLLWFIVLLIRRPGTWVHWFMALPCSVVLAAELIEYQHATEQSSNFYLTLALLGVSLLITAMPPLFFCVVAALAGWFIITLHEKPDNWINAIYAHLSAVMIGITLNMARRRLHVRLCRARLREQSHWQTLQKVQNDLIESNHRFQQFAEHSEQVFWINQWDPPAVLYANPAYETLTGRTVASLVNHPDDWLNCIHPSDRAGVRSAYMRMVENGRFDEEYRIVRPNGKVRWVRDQGVPVTNQQGVADRVAGIVSDITERRKVEDALRASQTKLYNLMANIDGIVWECLPDASLFTYVSPRAQAILGYPANRWTQEKFFWPSIIHPEDRDRIVTFCTNQIQAGCDHDATYRCIADDGSIVWLHDKVRIVYDEYGKISHLRGIMLDITASKQAEQELFASEERFRHLFEHSPDAVFVESMDGVVLDVNEAACRMHQMSREDLIGRTVQSLVPPDEVEHVVREFPRVATGEVTFFVGKSQPAHGEPIPVEIRAGQIDYEGQPALILHVRDISERIAAEQEKQELAEQVRQMQKLEAVGTLASGVAHDFNNLLTAIHGFSDMARRQLDPDHPVNEQVDMIEQAAEQGAGVTRSLLTFAQKLPTRKQAIDLGQITRDTVRLLHRLMPATIDLHDVCIDRPVWIHADANQMQQVLMNLAINGRDAMTKGGELTVTLEDIIDDDGLPHAQLTVNDTGAGMTGEVKQRMFEPFFTTKTQEQGTGLGLSIIHGILKEHGGVIDVDSTLGKGTTVTVNLPCCDKPEPTYELWHDPHPSHEGRRILLAEDNEYVRAIMTSTLQGEGFRVTAVNDGERLLAAFHKYEAGLGVIILDLDLPKTDGETCLSAIRDSGSDVPVIIVTANAHQFLDTPHAETVTLLSKPFPMGKLIEVINDVLSPSASSGV